MDELPEFAIIIEKIKSRTLEDEAQNMKIKLKNLETEIKFLKNKYEPSKRDTITLIYNCIRNVNHNNITKVIHCLNEDKFRCVSLKKREWQKKDENGIFMLPLKEESSC